MIKIGTYEIPEWPLNESIQLARLVAEKFNGQASRKEIAEQIGMSERGGAFAAKAGSMQAWGLVEGRGQMRLTKEMIALIRPGSNEEMRIARSKFTERVPLFAKLINALGAKVVDKLYLLEELERITGVDRRISLRKVNLIQRSLYQLIGTTLRSAEETDRSERQPQVKLDPLIHHQRDKSTEQQLHKTSGSNHFNVLKDGRANISLQFSGGNVILEENCSNIDAMMLILWNLRSQATLKENESTAPIFQLSSGMFSG